MRNTYEFKIEDITNCKIVSEYDAQQLTVVYNRMLNNPRCFLTKYQAHQDTEQEGTIGIICPRCGVWNYFDEESYNSDEVKNCKHCDSDYTEIYTEEELIDLLLSYMDEDVYYDTKLYINDVEIV